MELRIKNEIKKRISILKEQGMETDLDVLKIILEEGYCVSTAMNVYGNIAGVFNTVTANSHTYEVWNKALKKIAFYGAIPYLGMLMNTTMGELLSILYISKDEDQWELQCEELKRKNTCAFVYNISEDYAEFGYITYDMYNGGPIRTR